jgi:hypothetical protein
MSKGRDCVKASARHGFLYRASQPNEKRDLTTKISKIKTKRTAQQDFNDLIRGPMKILDNLTGLNYTIRSNSDLSFLPGRSG